MGGYKPAKVVNLDSRDPDGNGQYLDSDGNRVYLGNFDADGLNVNNNWDDNRNGNIGLSGARQS